MKHEDGTASDVDVYVASPPGKSGVSIAAIAFNNSDVADSFGRELKSGLDRLTRANGVFEIVMDAHGAFISFVTPWSEETVSTLLTGTARKLNVSVSIDHVSRSVADKLYQQRR